MKVVVVGDEDAVTGLRLAGVSEGRVVKAPEEAERVLREVARDEDVAVLVVTEDVASMAPSVLHELYLKPKPAVVEIPSKRPRGERREDPIRELLRRAVGVEVVVR